MSSTTAGFNEERQHRGAQISPVGVDYIPTEEEKRVFRECNNESFWYRSVPFSVVSMAVTRALIARGSLSASPRFGSLPKVAFSGFCGYLAGKMSYMKTCQEKFKRLDNSPLGEALRRRMGLSPQFPQGAQTEMSDPNSQSYDSMFRPVETPSSDPARGYGFNPEAPVGTQRDDFNAQGQPYEEGDEPKRKSILYEDLRLKNRENYEVTLTQKAESLLKTPQEKEPERPTKSVKKNIYGDTWEE
ncbi:OCIA domain-containing protein 1-like [Corythoichthys intestinalis]|uniref:OCIA domain-containing protein 1-like n=1 Tax=Corythoichthys intestinalis TaxID=161448 RepID=UPI0025A4ED80|nr:OCIA domain-containing protein 1-like [Corythoichthys intestinalis]XP_061792359.1 OCIA domain-containing protein 1-like [Nerophis lumbriciformis]